MNKKSIVKFNHLGNKIARNEASEAISPGANHAALFFFLSLSISLSFSRRIYLRIQAAISFRAPVVRQLCASRRIASASRADARVCGGSNYRSATVPSLSKGRTVRSRERPRLLLPPSPSPSPCPVPPAPYAPGVMRRRAKMPRR